METKLIIYITCLMTLVVGVLSAKSPFMKDSRMERRFGPILNAPPGRLYNCGEPKTKFHLTWTPSVLSPRTGAVINGSFIAPFNFADGVVNLTVWFDDSGSITPMFGYRHIINCDVMKSVEPSVRCPFKKNSLVPVYYRYISSVGLKGYAGTYIAQAELRTFKGEPILCARGTVKIVE